MLFSEGFSNLNLFVQAQEVTPEELLSSVQVEDRAKSSFGPSIFDKAKQLALTVTPNTDKIKIIDISSGSELGLASTKDFEEILGKIYVKNTGIDPNKQPQFEQAIQQLIKGFKTGQIPLEKIRVNPQTISFAAKKLIDEVQTYLKENNKQIEEASEGKSAEQVYEDIITIILASVISHETVHAEGGENLKSEPDAEAAGDEVYRRAVEDMSVWPKYNYLKEKLGIKTN